MEQNQKSEFIRPTWHTSVFQIIFCNWKHLINRKVQAKKVFWYMILHSYATLCVSFSSKSKATNVFPKHILELKARDKSIQSSKKLICHGIINNYLWNVLCKVLIKIESTWGAKSKMKHPRWLYSTVVALSEAATKAVLKNFAISPQKTPVLESPFKKLQAWRPATLLKRDPNTGIFLWILRNF